MSKEWSQKDIDNMVSVARKFYYGPRAVLEDIVSGLILESLEKGFYITTVMIRNRCIDQIRTEQRRKKLYHKLETENFSEDEEPRTENSFIDQAISLAELTELEKYLIWEKFWQNKSLAELQKINSQAPLILKLALQKIKIILEIERMKNEGV
ncbi:MAG: hypothetical protein WCR26_03265 [Sphaerochaetaceae bacterium]